MKNFRYLIGILATASLLAACDRVPNSANLSTLSTGTSAGSHSAERAAEDSLNQDRKDTEKVAAKINEKLENLGVKEDQLGLPEAKTDSGSVKGGITAGSPAKEQQISSDIEKKLDAKNEQLNADGKPNAVAQTEARANPVKGGDLSSSPATENKTNQEIEKKLDAKNEPLKTEPASTQPQPTPSAQ